MVGLLGSTEERSQKGVCLSRPETGGGTGRSGEYSRKGSWHGSGLETGEYPGHPETEAVKQRTGKKNHFPLSDWEGFLEEAALIWAGLPFSHSVLGILRGKDSTSKGTRVRLLHGRRNKMRQQLPNERKHLQTICLIRG